MQIPCGDSYESISSETAWLQRPINCKQRWTDSSAGRGTGGVLLGLNMKNMKINRTVIQSVHGVAGLINLEGPDAVVHSHGLLF